MQLSFLVEQEIFAWWGVPAPDVPARALGLAVDTGTARLARPDGGAMVTGPVAAALTAAGPTLAALRDAAPRPDWGRSVVAWREVAGPLTSAPPPDGDEAERLGATLPVAAHSGTAGDGTTIWSAAVAVRAAARAAHDAGDAGGAGDAGDRPGVWTVLRPYQRAGARWLADRLDEAGGALLADEMGLGKTVQAIAVLAGRPGPHLVVCPASVVRTWLGELARFAPELPAVEHARGSVPAGHGVVVATYGALARDDGTLAGQGWDVVVLDEAQQIRNPDTITSRRARTVTARGRIALTGTPVENRLDDLWSLLAFTAPDVLGSRARFRRRFSDPPGGDRSAAARRLSALVAPYLLRRRKSEVATELPPRLDLTHDVDPTDEQRRLGDAALDGALERGLGTGADRRGRVLALLTRLKQICVHPELVGASEGRLDGRSGSWDRLTELVTEIVDNDEAALVFTQYREAGTLLAGHLAERLGGEVPFLHGGLTRAARERIVTAFQAGDGPPVLLLSLRAAGTGLTLTRASHVLHLDRWWNPAVEAQASDRAHRIGQTRTVGVHTFTTRGTVEELIADLHRGKRDLSGAVLGEDAGGVGALARLGDDELRAVVSGARR